MEHQLSPAPRFAARPGSPSSSEALGRSLTDLDLRLLQTLARVASPVAVGVLGQGLTPQRERGPARPQHRGVVIASLPGAFGEAEVLDDVDGALRSERVPPRPCDDQ